MFRYLYLFGIYLLFYNFLHGQSSITLKGEVLNRETKSPLENCNILVLNSEQGTSSDKDGKFTLILSSGNHKVKFSHIGFESEVIEIGPDKRQINKRILLKPALVESDQVSIVAKREPPSITVQTIDSKDIRKMPVIYNDVLRSVQVLSGVTTNTELSSGYNVRGGTYDENLIYLNGYEIYRPFLLRIGVEENQNIINPDMVEKLTFYNGAFSPVLGDRMSSALEVDYRSTYNDELKGVFSASMLNLGMTLNNRFKNLNWSIGFRYANPALFLNSLKTQGDYQPSYSDIQILLNYQLNELSSIEILGIYSDNRFDISPTNWTGNFGFLGRGDYRGVTIRSDGDRVYSYFNNLFGVKYLSRLTEKSGLTVSLSKYGMEENEKFDLQSRIYYFPDALNPNDNLQFLKSRSEKGDNSVSLNSYRLKAVYDLNYRMHDFTLGAEYRISEIMNKINDSFTETGDSLITERPVNSSFSGSYTLNSFNMFIEDNFILNDAVEMNFGLRYLHYNYSKENLFSPRAYITYKFSPLNSLKFSWGYYFQPPFINELKSTRIENLKAQRAIHYILGWENQVNEKLKFTAEVYYKDLDDLIPFYFDEFRMVYNGNNSREGYAFGVDLMYEGEIVEDMKSWIGYSYLDTKEREKNGNGEYQRRLLDQTHTIQIFLQDKIKKYPNWQSHLRFLLGSGFLYYPRQLIADEFSNETYIEIDFTNPQEYFFYFRVDMGLSASFDLGRDYKITGIAEILNIFNQLNAGAYEWVHIFDDLNYAQKIPHVLSKRFFNLKLELTF